MSKPKKLDLPVEQLAAIALAINENSMLNYQKQLMDRVPTEMFIRKFNILRKDFSETIKGTGIAYNKSTSMYDIPEDLQTKAQETSIEVYEPQGNNIVTPYSYRSMPHPLVEVMEMSEDLKDMLNWYKKQNNLHENIVEIPEINVNNANLEGDIVTRSFKTYVNVLDKFSEYCKGKKETQKDLIALALCEFMDRYR